MKAEMFALLYKRAKQKNDIVVVEYSDDNKAKWSAVGKIIEYDDDILEMTLESGEVRLLPMMSVSSVSPYVPEESESLKPQEKAAEDAAEEKKPAATDEYNPHIDEIKAFLRDNKEAQQAASRIDNIIQSATKNHAISDKAPAIRLRIKEFVDIFGQAREAVLYAADRYAAIGDMMAAMEAFKICGEKNNAVYCARKMGDASLAYGGETVKTVKKTEKKTDEVLHGRISNWNGDKLCGLIAAEKMIDDREKFYFHISGIKDDRLREFLYKARSLGPKNIQVSFILGDNGNEVPAATRVEAMSHGFMDESPENYGVETGFISSYKAFSDIGYIKCGNMDIGFRISAVVDPYLREYLQKMYGVGKIEVFFTMRKSKGKSVADKMMATKQGREEIVLQLGNTNKYEKYDKKVASVENEAELLTDTAERTIKRGENKAPAYRELPLWEEKEIEPITIVSRKSRTGKNPLEGRVRKYPEEKYPCDKGVGLIINNPKAAQEYFLDALQSEDNVEKSLKSLLGNVILNTTDDPYSYGYPLLVYFGDDVSDVDFLKLKIQMMSKSVRKGKLDAAEIIEPLKQILDKVFTANLKKHYLNLLASSLYKMHRYADAIDALEELRKIQIEDKQPKLVLNTDRMIANNYYRMGNTEKAKEIAEKILKSNSDDELALAIMNDNLQNVDEVLEDMAFESVEDFENLKGYPKYKVDSIVLDTLAIGKWRDYIEDNEIVVSAQKVIDEIPVYVDQKIKGMAPASRGDGWAFLAKVTQQLLENEAEHEMLAKKKITIQRVNEYAGQSMLCCGDYVVLSGSNNWDTLRFYYSQTLNMVPEKFNDAKNAMNRMICSYYIQGSELVDVVQNAQKLENRYLELAGSEECSSLRSMFILSFQLDGRSNARVKQLLETLLKNRSENDNEIHTFAGLADEFGIETDTDSANRYYEAWQKIRNEYNRWLMALKKEFDILNNDVSSTKTLNDHISYMEKTLGRGMFFETDEEYLKKYVNVLKNLQMALKTNEFDRCEDLFQRVIDDSGVLYKMIYDAPTALAFENLREAVETVRNYTIKKLDELYDLRKPRLTVTSSGGFLDGDKLPLNFSIRNEQNVQSAEIVAIDFEPDMEGFSIKNNMTSFIQHVKSGTSEEGSRLIVLDKDADLKYVEMHMSVEFSYRIKHDEVKTEKLTTPIHVELRDKSLFSTIDNPYTEIAESGQVKGEMFRGREGDIKEIVGMLKTGDGMLAHRGIIMYGQKRAGKSSILANLQERIEQEYGKDTYLFFDIGSIGAIMNPNTAGILSTIMEKINGTLRRNYRDIYKRLVEDGINFPYEEIEKSTNNADLIFNRSIGQICEKLEEYGGKDKYIPMFFIDEFTYIYQWIKSGIENMSNFPHFWKAFLQNNRVCSIVVGQDNTQIFTHMPLYANDFACMKTWPVSYLKEEGAKELIVDPIRTKTGESRFTDEAVDEILNLTAGSAFLIVFFLDKLVEWMNTECRESVTKMTLTQFMPHLFANYSDWNGLFEAQIVDPSKIAAEAEVVAADNRVILSCIACNCDSEGWVEVESITCDGLSEREKHYRDILLDELVRRDVLIEAENRGSKKYKIKVGLLKKYLKHEYESSGGDR